MRLIDGHIVMERLQEQTEVITNHEMVAGLLMAQGVVLETPTIDAVEVVRCKDCKWHLNGHLCKQLSQYGSIETPPSFYCGFGERRQDFGS